MEKRVYLCIDLKSFYASVECVERGLDPLQTNLAVADPDRGIGTICLAISPSMKALGIKNRCRVYEIPSYVEYIKAPPRMKLYIQYSADIYAVYLKYVAKEDVHVYSIDEAFLDVTPYLSLYRLTAKELAVRIMDDIKKTTGITAAAGIGTNLYLAKVALDIMAKHEKDNIAFLDEGRYQKSLWNHMPLTDFWRVGAGTVKRLRRLGIFTMRDVAHADEEALYRMFGVDAELLIDHAWGRESTTMEDIKNYRPKSKSLSSGQVFLRDYTFEECRLVVKEVMDELCLEMAEMGMVTKSISLVTEYSAETGMKSASGTVSLTSASNRYRTVLPGVLRLYDRIVRKDKPIRRLTLACHDVAREAYEQLELFSDPAEAERDRKIQKTVIEIKKRYGRNAIVRGMDLQEAGTAMQRNRQIGGHRSGE